MMLMLKFGFGKNLFDPPPLHVLVTSRLMCAHCFGTTSQTDLSMVDSEQQLILLKRSWSRLLNLLKIM